ncbi:MAG TPA: heme-binding protein [Geminicoccaceae bacterium]|nr:heme-binding protein [Geminicoccus sp.]HMU51552.1 heme-binding protein [Geminicoccaceae bacterium]
MRRLGLEAASLIVDTAIAEARRRGLAPLAVAVLDAGGHLVAFKREDRAGILRFEIAFAKAWGALGMGFGTRELANRSATFVNALATMSGGRVAPSPGGVLVADDEGEIVGAVGISGDKGEMDEACAVAGIAAAGLRSHTGIPEG